MYDFKKRGSGTLGESDSIAHALEAACFKRLTSQLEPGTQILSLPLSLICCVALGKCMIKIMLPACLKRFLVTICKELSGVIFYSLNYWFKSSQY